ncbi:MAG: lipoate--protein ligase family protein [Candidatus Dormibacteraeota bacterium]|nr:lipoate--protein ligase family protein [Candidatus Dormibacteraeota bacterium]
MSADATLDAPFLLQLDPPAPGVVNMRRDADLLDRCNHGAITGALRLYGFAPACLSLGRLQPSGDVDMEACARAGVDVVRRPSGGRAVLHYAEVTYAVVCSVSDETFGGGVLDSCARIHGAVAAGLRALGVATVAQAPARDVRRAARAAARSADCFAVPGAHELVDAQGRKVVGSAQARQGAALLQHGSVLLRAPDASRYLRAARRAPDAAGVSDILGRDVRREELVRALVTGFAAALGTRLRRDLQETFARDT